MIINALCPLRVRRSAGDLHLQPGYPIVLPDEEAVKLLSKVPGKIRAIDASTARIEPAVNPDGPPLSAICWATGDGRILGPEIPEFFMRDGDTFWIGTTFEALVRWINADRLRSRKALLEQSEVREVELIHSL